MKVDYHSTLIAVADDCPVEASVVPTARAGRKTLPQLQYEMLVDRPYEYTSAEILFETNMRHKGVSAAELKAKARRSELWEAFFSKPQPCLRTSGLAKKYGWGLHCNAEGKVALCAMESPEYRRLVQGKPAGSVTVVKAMRSARA